MRWRGPPLFEGLGRHGEARHRGFGLPRATRASRLADRGNGRSFFLGVLAHAGSLTAVFVLMRRRIELFHQFGSFAEAAAEVELAYHHIAHDRKGHRKENSERAEE